MLKLFSRLVIEGSKVVALAPATITTRLESMCFGHAMGRGRVGITIFGRWCCYDPIGIGVANHS